MSYAKKAKRGYCGIAEYRDKNGKRHQKSAGCFKLKRDATKTTQQLEDKYSRVNTEMQVVTFVDYYQNWFSIYKENSSLPDITKSCYCTFSKTIAGHFKDTKLVNIKRSTYQQSINRYGASHAFSSVSKLNGVTRACVSYAIDDDIIVEDSAHNVQLVYNEDNQTKVEYLTNKEVRSLKKAVVANLNHCNTSRYMILTVIYTGMRKSEIQTLTWNDIDFLYSTITITKSWDDAEKASKTTRTESSQRTTEVSRQLLNRLAELKANNTTMVFQNVLGTIPTSNALNKCLWSIISECGIEKQGFYFHSLRHVHVAYLLSKGVDIYAVSKRSGHSNITITLNIYSYLIDEYKAKNDTLIIDKLPEL